MAARRDGELGYPANFTNMSDDELLHLVRKQSAWEDLHALCLDRRVAEQLVRVLRRRAHDLAYETAVWIDVIKEIHPDFVGERLGSTKSEVDAR